MPLIIFILFLILIPSNCHASPAATAASADTVAQGFADAVMSAVGIETDDDSADSSSNSTDSGDSGGDGD